MKRTFFVRAVWDAEAEVFISESDIDGLHIETDDLEEFQAIMADTAIELIVNNHMSLPELATTPLRDLIPAIIWHAPVLPVAA